MGLTEVDYTFMEQKPSINRLLFNFAPEELDKVLFLSSCFFLYKALYLCIHSLHTLLNNIKNSSLSGLFWRNSSENYDPLILQRWHVSLSPLPLSSSHCSHTLVHSLASLSPPHDTVSHNFDNILKIRKKSLKCETYVARMLSATTFDSANKKKSWYWSFK